MTLALCNLGGLTVIGNSKRLENGGLCVSTVLELVGVSTAGLERCDTAHLAEVTGDNTSCSGEHEAKTRRHRVLSSIVHNRRTG